MNIDQVSSSKKITRRLGACVTLLALLVATPRLAEAQTPPPLFTSAPTFFATNHYVATAVFHWYTTAGGQLTGPWLPLEGRTNWTGEPAFWKGQVKQMMRANIDVLYVHLYPGLEQQRVNLFSALNELRAEGYDTPKIAPFLDQQITWNAGPAIDLATGAGKDEFVNQYIRFYNQYYSVSGTNADDYLARQANKPVLDMYVMSANNLNVPSLTRADVSNRLFAAFGAAHPYFTNGFVMVSSVAAPSVSFADEKVHQFEIMGYTNETLFNSIRSLQIKPGYWDQNIRNPGAFLARAGGVHFSNAWNQVNRATTQRVYLESWNEYDEGSGMYASSNTPYIAPANISGNTDTWSTTGDPFEYIKTAARGAASFNDTPAQGAKILWHNIPATLTPGETRTVTVIIRNTGDESWTAATNYKLGQGDADTTFVAGKRVLINDTQDEIPLYGGIFRGRAKAFQMTLTAPALGSYSTHWRMLQEGVTWFGEELVVPITVRTKTAATVTLTNLAQVADGTAKSVSATTTPPGLTVNLSYNGSLYPPTTAGSYTVIGIINDPDYQGRATNTLVLTANPSLLANGSFEAQTDGTSITSPPDFIAGGIFTGWRAFDVASAEVTFSATIISNASAGSHAMRLDVNKTTGNDNYGLDQWDVGMHTPVVYGTKYLVSFDAAWIAGATANNLLAYVNEFDNTGTYIGTSENLGAVAVSATGYQAYAFLWTPQNPGTTEIGFAFRPLSSVAGATTLSLDNVQMLDATDLPSTWNGSFEYSPLGAAAVSGTGNPNVDTGAFLGWRFLNVVPDDYTTFNAVIVTNASVGVRAMQLTTIHATTGSGGSSGLDMNNNRIAIDDTKAYLLTFDAAWVSGATANNLGLILAQFDAADNFLGQPVYSLSVSDTSYKNFTIYYKPAAGTTQLNPNFQPMLNTAGSTTLRLDNVQLVDASTIPAPWNGSFEYSPAGGTVNAPQGGGDVVNWATLVGWRFVGVDSANASFSATIITNASAGKQALRFDKSANGPSYIDQWDAGMQTPVVYGSTYLVTLDAAYISGVTPNAIGIGAQEYTSGVYAGTGEGIGTASVSSTNYTKYAFLWTLQNPVANEISLQLTPAAGAVSVDNIQIVDITNLPALVNSSFEYSPIGTIRTLTTPTADGTTFVGWRLFSVGAPPTTSFTGTIVDAGNYTGGTAGSHAMRLDIDNTGTPADFDYGLDNDNNRIPVTVGNHYSLTFDLELDGISGGVMALAVGIAEFDVNGNYLGNAPDYVPMLPTDQTFHHYSRDYVPVNPDTTQIAISFRPRNPGFISALVLDNVVFGLFTAATTPTNISYSVDGSALTLTWPGSHLGWLAESNSVNVADTNYWFTIPGSQSMTNLTITISPAQPKVFYRLRLP